MSQMLAPAYRELDYAQESHDRLKNLSRTQGHTLTDVEREWRRCVTHLEKCWKRVDQCCASVPRFAAARSLWGKQRGEDPTLRYVKQARNADTHTIQEIVAERESKTLRWVPVRDPFGRQPMIEVTLTDGRMFSTACEQLVAEGLPFRLELLPIVNRGVTYKPPVRFFQNVLPWPDPIAISRMAIDWHRKYLDTLTVTLFRAPDQAA